MLLVRRTMAVVQEPSPIKLTINHNRAINRPQITTTEETIEIEIGIEMEEGRPEKFVK